MRLEDQGTCDDARIHGNKLGNQGIEIRDEIMNDQGEAAMCDSTDFLGKGSAHECSWQ